MADHRLFSLVEECVSRMGAHVVDLVVRGEHAQPAVEVFVDAEDGITTEICSKLSREIGNVIDRDGQIKTPYTLTVSSPGIARPLKFPWQYRKHVGRSLEVKVRSGDSVRAESGKFVGLDNNGITLERVKKGEQTHIGFHEIVEAKVLSPW